MHLTPELLDAMVLLNSWARGNGRAYAGSIYAVKSRFLRCFSDRGWTFRTSVIVECKKCGGWGYIGHHANECWDCGGGGKVTLQFVVTEFHQDLQFATFHTPRHLSGLSEEEFGKLQMVPPGDWLPNQPGADLDKAAGISLLLQMESALCGRLEVV